MREPIPWKAQRVIAITVVFPHGVTSSDPHPRNDLALGIATAMGEEPLWEV
jgi:hypothetical protein